MESGCQGGREGDGDVRAGVFDVEGDDLRFQDEEVFDQEEATVGGGAVREGGDGRGCGDEGPGRDVYYIMSEVVENGGLEAG